MTHPFGGFCFVLSDFVRPCMTMSSEITVSSPARLCWLDLTELDDAAPKPSWVTLNVVSWLVARFAIAASISKLFWTLVMFGRFTIVARNLAGGIFFVQKNVCVKNSEHFFWKKYCFSPCPKRIRPLIKPLLKNSFSTNFQGTGSWEGPIHFSRCVLRVHNCSKLF